jgi:hypothetical protein
MEFAARDLREKRSAGAPEISESAFLLVIFTVFLPPRRIFPLKGLEISVRGDG